MRILLKSIVVFSILLCSVSALDLKDIIKKVNLQSSPISEEVSFKMTLIDKNNTKRERTATYFSKRVDSTSWESMKLIRFHTPAEMARSAVLLIEQKTNENQQWIYLPSTYTTRQIPTQKRGDRYMGTDYSYEDATSSNPEKYRYELIASEKNCLVIQQVSTDSRIMKESLYSKSVLWIDTVHFVITKAEYYDKSNNLIKKYSASNYKEYKKFYRPDHTEMTDLKFKHTTIIDYLDRKIGIPLTDNIFTVRALERDSK